MAKVLLPMIASNYTHLPAESVHCGTALLLRKVTSGGGLHGELTVTRDLVLQEHVAGGAEAAKAPDVVDAAV